MTRDLDLIREILLVFEKAGPAEIGAVSTIILPPWSSEQIVYNCNLLAQAKFIDVVDTSSMAKNDMLFRNMTLTGHDYLEAVRSAAIWNKVKSKLKTTGIDASLDIVKTVAAALVLAALK